ncbi:hypothetical protein [Fusobacterium sp. THCT1E2]
MKKKVENKLDLYKIAKLVLCILVINYANSLIFLEIQFSKMLSIDDFIIIKKIIFVALNTLILISLYFIYGPSKESNKELEEKNSKGGNDN